MPYQLRLDIQHFQNKPAALPSYEHLGVRLCLHLWVQCMCWCFYRHGMNLPTGTYAEATTEPLVTTYDEAESVLDVQE